MGMKRLGILHITDLHVGFQLEASKIKNSTLSGRLRDELDYKDPRTLFLRKVLHLLEDQRVDVLAFTGDIGWGKDSKTLSQGIVYLSKLSGRLNIEKKFVIIAPGNHDLERKAAGNQELDEFVKACDKEGFTYAAGLRPAFIRILDIPIIALNTCLGGTEHALHGLPEDFWKAIQGAVDDIGALSNGNTVEIPAAIKSQLKAMDIPAVGHSQVEKLEEYLREKTGNCAIILGHHNPLPTHALVVRPYAELVDSGQLIFSLIDSGRRILFLHGHTHCDSVLVAQSPENRDTGFIACLGGTGLNELPGGGSASASYIQVLADESCNFLAAVVSRFYQNGAAFSKRQSFFIWDIPTEPSNPRVKINELEPRKTLFFDELADKYAFKDRDALAIELLRRTSYRQIQISGLERSLENWRITRNP